MDVQSAPDTRSRLRLWESLPPFHPVALRLMKVISSESVPLTEIASIIRCDAAFAAEILRLANSPLFGFNREISSILHAVGLLGLERVRGLALTVALRRLLGNVPPSVAARVCWRHNLACAMVAEELAVAAMMSSDVVYTAGLVHDIGRLALLASDPARYAALLASSEPEPSMLCQLERHSFGLDHCQVGAVLMEHWNFPKELRDIADLHHDPLAPGRFGLMEVVKVACRTADALGFQVTGTTPPFDPDILFQMLPDSARSRMPADAGQMSAAIAIKINSFEICG